jgi:hypothetical protein
MHKRKNIFRLKLYDTCFLLILFLSTGFSTFSQETVKDSIRIANPKLEHSPHKATVYSAILPGLGQIYNRKYWKVPLIFGGFATLGYFINFNNEVYQTYKQAYSDIIDTDPFTNSYLDLNINPSFFSPDKTAQLTENLSRAKDNWRRNRDLCIIGTVVFYAVNVIDASVDAHFFNFDISDDLTINWTPGPIMCMDKKAIGLQCRFTF